MSKGPFHSLSGLLGSMRWLFMPLGLFAVVAVGVHAAADQVDDSLLALVEVLDAWLDALLARSELLSPWVNRVDSRERTLMARGITLAWELAVDVAVALPALGYGEAPAGDWSISLDPRRSWRALASRLTQRPTPMRLLFPLVTAVFALGGAYTVARLVESTLFVGLQGDVASPDVAAAVARTCGGVALLLVVATVGWRAVLRALMHADARCLKVEQARRRALLTGAWSCGLSIPLALALASRARDLLSLVL